MISTNRLPYHCGAPSSCALRLRAIREDWACSNRRRRPDRMAQALGRVLMWRWRGVVPA